MMKRKGTCPVCGKLFTVRADGTIGSHQNDKIGENTHGFCLGSYEVLPVETSKQGFQKVISDALNQAQRQEDNLATKPDYNPKVLARWAKEAAAYRQTAARLERSASDWSPGHLVEVAAPTKRKDYGSGTCCVCTREFKLKKDGTLRSHSNHPGAVNGECYGSSLLPLEVSADGCKEAVRRLRDKCDYLATAPLSEPERPSSIRHRSEKLEYFRFCLRAALRNQELWSKDQPIHAPTDLPPTVRQDIDDNFTKARSSRSGCLGAVLVFIVFPVLAITAGLKII